MSRLRRFVCSVIVLALAGVSLPVAELVAQDHSLFDAVLRDHVKNGRVNYSAIKSDPRFKRYMDLLANTDPNSIKGWNENLAFWINVYNAYTIKLITDNYPVKSIMDLAQGEKTAWDRITVTVKGATYSLNQVEHSIIRGRYFDPRIHFALVCAAMSCPPLISRAYLPATLSAQLEMQARAFITDPDQNKIDPYAKTARISSLFKWYQDDFTKKGSLLEYLAGFLPAEKAAAVRGQAASIKISYRPYDWSLNE